MVRFSPTRLNLETLDAREMPAVVVIQMNGDLIFNGTNSNDTVVIRPGMSITGEVTLEVRVTTSDWVGVLDDDTYLFGADEVTRIRFFGQAGDDVLDTPGMRMVAEGGRGNDRLIGRGRLDGGADNDTIVGSDAADTIRGGIGNDVIFGRGGADFLYGDADNDSIRAGPGNDYVYAGAGGDVIHGEAGRDILHGEAGGDFIDGGAENDTIFGDEFFPAATDGNDWLLGGVGRDQIYAGGGNDYADGGYDTAVDVIYLGPGRDRFTAYLIGYRDAAGRVFAVTVQDQTLDDSAREDTPIYQPLRVL
jgi:Ca2+-binding RTX toxin-like protein